MYMGIPWVFSGMITVVIQPMITVVIPCGAYIGDGAFNRDNFSTLIIITSTLILQFQFMCLLSVINNIEVLAL